MKRVVNISIKTCEYRAIDAVIGSLSPLSTEETDKHRTCGYDNHTDKDVLGGDPPTHPWTIRILRVAIK